LGNKRQRIWQLKQENLELRKCLKALVDLYVVQYDPETGTGGFIVDHRPPDAGNLSPLQRRRDKWWSLWDKACLLLGLEPCLPESGPL
jgi:hypothetical protein